MQQQPKRIVIIGGVAAGATAAARLRRMDEAAEITIIERGRYVSFANCGLPYFISRDIEKRSKLILQTPEGFFSRYRVDVRLRTEATAIDTAHKTVALRTEEGESTIAYDALILAQGGNPIVLPIPGGDAPNVFSIWTIPDMDRIHKFIEAEKPQHAVIAGAGFIGIEMAEAFHQRGIHTTIVELTGYPMPLMDPEFGGMVRSALEEAGIAVKTDVALAAVRAGDRQVDLSDGSALPADLVLFSVGVRPNTQLAQSAGLVIGNTGALLVNEFLRTSDPWIFAAGDMVEIVNRVSNQKTRVPLAGPANRQGRIMATNVLNALHGESAAGAIAYHGAFGTSVVKVCDYTAGSTGLSETAATKAGYDVGTATVHREHHAGYYPGAEDISVKLVYDRATRRLLGGQAFGKAGVDKRIDALATALYGKLSLEDLSELDLAYAPPYSSANDPINMAAFVALNDLQGYSPAVGWPQLRDELQAAGERPFILDVRTLGDFGKGHIADAVHLPVDEIRDRLAEIPRDRRIVVCSRNGFEGHLATRTLLGNGFSRVRNLNGGYISASMFPKFTAVV